MDVNPQKVVNLHHRTLEEYFYEKCIVVEGDDIDDEVSVIHSFICFFINLSHSICNTVGRILLRIVYRWNDIDDEVSFIHSFKSYIVITRSDQVNCIFENTFFFTLLLYSGTKKIRIQLQWMLLFVIMLNVNVIKMTKSHISCVSIIHIQ